MILIIFYPQVHNTRNSNGIKTQEQVLLLHVMYACTSVIIVSWGSLHIDIDNMFSVCMFPHTQNFLVTPHTQESYRKIDEEFDHLLRQNQIPQQPVQGPPIQVNINLLDTSCLFPLSLPPPVNFYLGGGISTSLPFTLFAP